MTDSLLIKTIKRRAIIPTRVRLQWGQIDPRYPSLIQSGKSANVCACCGESADTVTRIRYGKAGHQTWVAIHEIPSCSRCKTHQEAVVSGGLVGILFLMLVFFLAMMYFISEFAEDRLGMLYGVLILIAGELPLWFWAIKKMERREKKLEPLMGERCTGLTFCSFKRDTKGFIDQIPVDVFDFTNREYALRFAELNDGKVVYEH